MVTGDFHNVAHLQASQATAVKAHPSAVHDARGRELLKPGGLMGTIAMPQFISTHRPGEPELSMRGTAQNPPANQHHPGFDSGARAATRSEEHTSELQSLRHLV